MKQMMIEVALVNDEFKMAGHRIEFAKVERRKEVARFCVLSTGKNQSLQ